MASINSKLLESLFVVTGRASGSDSDTSYVVEANSEGHAKTLFIEQVRHDTTFAGGSYYDTDENEEVIVFVVQITPLVKAINNRVQPE